MWILIFALFTVCGVISGSPDICDKRGSDICYTPPEQSVEFPDSIAALDKICPILTTKLRCLVDYQKQCGLEIMESFEIDLEKIYELFLDICDKDSELHQELSVQLPCLERVITDQRNACQPIIEDSMEAIQNRILVSADRDTTEGPEEWRKYICLVGALEHACVMAYASVTCGDASKQLVGEVMDRGEFLDTICQADIREEVREMVSVMELEMEEGIALRNSVSKV